MNVMTGTPFASTIDHLAGRLVDQRVVLAAAWLERLKSIVPVEARDVFPTPTLLDHIPELIGHIARYLRASDEQAIEANAAIMQKATELGLLRFDQRAPVGQLLREYETFSEILDRFWSTETAALGPGADATAAVVVVSRSHKAVRALQQRTVDVLVASYTDRIQRKTAQLRTFSQLVSHEIRQPLGVLQVVARVLKQPADSSEGPRMVATLERNVVRLGEVADKLERMARLTRPSRELETPQRVEVADVVADVVVQLGDTAEAAGVTFEIGDRLPTLVADAGRVELVLANLLVNAIKYRDPAKPRRVVRVVADESAPHARLRVEDNGLGIPQARREEIFDHFTRAHAHLDDELGTRGLGLGLAIVRDCMANMGGSVTVTSKEGQGTVFTLEWPSSPPPQTTASV